MPIMVRVVNDRDYTAWIEQAKKKYATDDSHPTAVAAADSAN
jgi:heme/copper-type cytochrome/quinol oxidase subunit 2